MTVSALILDYIRVLAWPCLALTTLLILRPHISDLFGRMRTGEVDALGVKLRIDLAEAHQAVEVERRDLTSPESDDAIRLVREEFDHLFEDVDRPLADLPHPQSAVVRAFIGLLGTVGKSAEMLGVSATKAEANEPGSGGSYQIDLKRLKDAGVVDRRLAEAIARLESVYERQARGEVKVDQDMALLYTQTAVATSQVIAASTLQTLSRKNLRVSESPGAG